MVELPIDKVTSGSSSAAMWIDTSGSLLSLWSWSPLGESALVDLYGKNSGHQKQIFSCGRLAKPDTTYILQKDVSSPGTCFSIEAENVTLNLNNHTIIYETAPQKSAHFGILGIACWDPDLTPGGIAEGNPCGKSFENFTVYGPGRIQQGAGMAPYSHPIRFGQGIHSGPSVHDVDFTWSADSSIGVYVNYAGVPGVKGGSLYHCTFHNNVKVIYNRHSIDGLSVKFDQSAGASSPTLIYNNEIVGGAQGGLYTLAPGSLIYGNAISQDGTYANDFGIYVWGERMFVHNNQMRPTQGRGISIDGIVGSTIGSEVFRNSIEVLEKSNNIEYGGCQAGGSYGIQFDDNPERAVASENTVTAYADQCDGTGLRVTDSRAGQHNLSERNHFTAIRSGARLGHAYGLALAGPTGFESMNDTYVADTADLFVDWGGASNVTCVACTFAKGTNPDPSYVTLSFKNGGTSPVKNLHLIDATFLNGASKDSTDMRPINSNQDWPGPSEYFIDWTYALRVEDASGRGIAGAAVIITDALGNHVFNGTTDRTGQVTTVLTEFRRLNTAKSVIREAHTPHTVSIGKETCRPKPRILTLSVAQPTAQKVRLLCRSD